MALNTTRCPNCLIGVLKTWKQLDDEEKLIASARPSPDETSIEHRRACHLWCPRCWFEMDQSLERIEA